MIQSKKREYKVTYGVCDPEMPETRFGPVWGEHGVLVWHDSSGDPGDDVTHDVIAEATSAAGIAPPSDSASNEPERCFVLGLRRVNAFRNELVICLNATNTTTYHSF